MVTPFKFLLVLLFSAGAAWAAPAVLPSEGVNRVALVIGNARYKSGQTLTNPVNDATDIARKLRELGFTKVVLGIDMDKRAMRKSLREFRDALRPGDVALAYYAGHGVMVGGVNYMVPIDAKLDDEDDVKDDALPMDDLLKTMEESRTRTNILVLDACRDNPFKLHSRVRASKAQGLASMQDIAGEGTQIIYAARPGKTASDGAGRNGVFTAALLEHIDTPGLTLNDLVGRLADDVRRITGNKQQPWAEGLLTGTFTFKVRQPVADKSAIPNPQQEETEFWGEAKAAGNADGYQAYIEQYPNGRYVGLARAHIKRLGEKGRPPSEFRIDEAATTAVPAKPKTTEAPPQPPPPAPPSPAQLAALKEIREKESADMERKQTELRAEEQRRLAQREAERMAAEKQAAEKAAVELAAEKKRMAEAEPAKEEQKIQLASVSPQVSAPARPATNDGAVDPKFAAIISALKRLPSGNDLRFEAFSAALISANSVPVIEKLKKYGDSVHAMQYRSAIAWAIEPNGKVAWGRAWGFSHQDLADERALQGCRNKLTANLPSIKCQVFYRSRDIDPLVLSKIVEAAQGTDYDGWQKGVLQSFETFNH
jgi:hypothetical protein